MADVAKRVLFSKVPQMSKGCGVWEFGVYYSNSHGHRCLIVSLFFWKLIIRSK